MSLLPLARHCPSIKQRSMLKKWPALTACGIGMILLLVLWKVLLLVQLVAQLVAPSLEVFQVLWWGLRLVQPLVLQLVQQVIYGMNS